MWEVVKKSLTEYENNSWIVYECTYYGMSCGSKSITVYYVVKADTVIEIDPEYDKGPEDEMRPDTIF
jgi:hypothetical protein